MGFFCVPLAAGILLLSSLSCSAAFEFGYSPESRSWLLSNGTIQAQFQLTPDDTFQLIQMDHREAGDVWRASSGVSSSPIRFTLDTTVYDRRTRWKLIRQWTEAVNPGGYRQSIVLADLGGTVEVTLAISMYEDQPVVRLGATVKNLKSREVLVRLADMLPITLEDEGATYSLFRVNQWGILPKPVNFEPLTSTLNPSGAVIHVQSGSRGQQCGWFALRDSSNRGLFAGWEFNGRADTQVKHTSSTQSLQFNSLILDLVHPLPPDQEFAIPTAFVGLFHGDWDEAGFRTQRFLESVLARPAPGDNFPYVVWDSWGYTDQIHEDLLRRNAEVAARMGFELFVVDLGWARKIGEWNEDPEKFPSGIRALSDYVHSLGMKFGLHFAVAEAAPDSPVLLEHPDWTTSEDYHYFGAKSLCLSNRPARDWIIAEATRVIEEYGIDWILQDGEGMVKTCTKPTHTHDARDSNYMNAVEGIDAVVERVQKLKPDTAWENCEDGGNMMTFKMVQMYVTSITNDASGTLDSRQAAYGATYPFPPRYVDRYMPAGSLDRYTTRSFVFGGPWVFMNRLVDLSEEDRLLAEAEIRAFKRMREDVRDGKVYHLSSAPAENRTDAIQSYNAESDRAVAVVTRDQAQSSSYTLRFKGLNAGGTYQVTFQDSRNTLLMTGQQLMNSGVRLVFDELQDAEIVWAQGVTATGSGDPSTGSTAAATSKPTRRSAK